MRPMPRPLLLRLLACAVLTALWILPMTTTSVAGSTGSVVFQLTLRGDVPPTDRFRVLRDTVPPSIIEQGLLVCAPAGQDDEEGLPTCVSGGTYQLESPMLPVGTALTYGIVRNDARVDGLSGSVTVSAGPRSTLISLTYDYSFGTLPNTALPRLR